MKRAKRQNRSQQTRNPEAQKLPFIEHLYELRKRLFYVAVFVALFSTFAYLFERSIIVWLLQPAGKQHFIYTSPIGGIDFLFRVCIYIGIAASIPVIVYQFLRYMEPLVKNSSMRFIATGSVISGVLALCGIAFGYFIGLPAALHFLLHQFVFTKQIQPLITIQSYMSFVGVYMFGSALLFQVPLLLLFINRIKPLNPKKLISMKYQRWVIVGAFVGGGIMNPNPDLLDQVVIVGPLILMYELGVAIIWFGKRKHTKPAFVTDLLKHDTELQALRQQRFDAAREVWQQKATQVSPSKPNMIAPASTFKKTATPRPAAMPVARATNRPVIRRRYVDDVNRPVRPYRTLDQRISLDSPGSQA